MLSEVLQKQLRPQLPPLPKEIVDDWEVVYNQSKIRA